MRLWLWAVLVAVATLCQVAWLPIVRPFGLVPNIVLALLALVALEESAVIGLGLAVAAGLVCDLMGGGNFGIWTGVLVLEVLVAAQVRQAGVETDRLVVPVAMVVAGTILMAMLVLGGLVGQVALGLLWPQLGRIVGEILLNLGLMLVWRPVVRRVAALQGG